MKKKSILFSLFGIILLNFIFILAQEKDEISFKKESSIDLLFYLHEEKENYIFTRVLPFYSYKVIPSLLSDEFFFWPFLVNYKVYKNPIPKILPSSSNFQWSIFPFLTINSSNIIPEEDKETSTFISFMFLTYFQQSYIKNEYLSRIWYSLPLLSFYENESLVKKEDNIWLTNTTLGTPLFFFSDIKIFYKDKFYPTYKWAINPLTIPLGEDFFNIIYYGRWGKDYEFKVLSFKNLSLFYISTTFSPEGIGYPGYRYKYFSNYEKNIKKGIENLININRVDIPVTKCGILSPIILFKSSPIGDFSWQFLPLFYYKSTIKDFEFNILPLGLNINNKGIEISFKYYYKLFPIIYYDEDYKRLDILWPLFCYINNPRLFEKKISFQFIFDYTKNINSNGEYFTSFNLLEGILFSYNNSPDYQKIELLPGGFIFGYYKIGDSFQFRFLGFGYLENNEKKFLQLLFIKIPIGYKEVENND